MKLSIIIPYYDTFEYTKDLLKKLIPQLTEEVEVIIVDDGCGEFGLDFITGEYKQMKCIHCQQNSKGASRPRNIGIKEATGEYIAFIDSDDMVGDDYIKKILRAIEKKPDIVFLSWQSKVQKVIMNMQPPRWNCAVWCRVYKRETIINDNVRFDENLRIAEDYKFNQDYKWKTKMCIKDIIYYYNNGRKGSLING